MSENTAQEIESQEPKKGSDVSDEAYEERGVKRFRFAFHIYTTVFVVITAFTYGLSTGLTRDVQPAVATFGFGEGVRISPQLAEKLPGGVDMLPVGEEIVMNGKNAEMASFFSNRGVRRLVKDAVRRWEKDGVKVIKMATGQRGIALGHDEVRGKRYSMTVWLIPKPMRQFTGASGRVQGILTIQDEGRSPLGSEVEDRGEVPGVPLRPDGKGGAVISSKDPGGRSYSSVYTNPGDIASNLAFYRTEMSSRGWREVSAEVKQTTAKGHGHLRMGKGPQELNLLFSPVRGTPKPGEEKTVVMVMVGGNVLDS